MNLVQCKEYKILFMTLPRVYFDRSMHDRTTDFGETIQYVMNKFRDSNVSVDVYDFSITGRTLRYIYSKLKNNYDMVVMFTDVPDASIARKIGFYLKEISPLTKLIIYGDATIVIPQFFKRKPFDAFYMRGDQEVVIEKYIQCVIGQEKWENLKGICFADDKGHYIEKDGYYRADVNEWAFPALSCLPIDVYKKFANTYRGNEYICAFYVSKGCNKGCKYCLCSKREGVDERWRDVKSCVDFIQYNLDQFQMYKLHAANLAGNKDWLIEFCHQMIKRGLNKKVKWKGTICLLDMDYELAKLCNEAGAYSFGFGVESFFKADGKGVKFSVAEFERRLRDLKNVPVRWKGYVMYNMPNQNVEDVEYTVDVLRRSNVVVRAASYTPFYLLSDKNNEKLDTMNLEMWNKKEFLQWRECGSNEVMWKAYIKQLRI